MKAPYQTDSIIQSVRRMCTYAVRSWCDSTTSNLFLYGHYRSLWISSPLPRSLAPSSPFVSRSLSSLSFPVSYPHSLYSSTFVPSFIHSFTHSLIHSFIHSIYLSILLSFLYWLLARHSFLLFDPLDPRSLSSQLLNQLCFLS